MQPQITPRSWLMVAILGFVWGATFVLVEIALRGISPFWLATYRLGIAALMLGGIWTALRCPLALDPQNRPKPWQYLWSGAISSALPFMLLIWGQTHVTSGFAGTTMAAVPLLVLPLAHILVPGERLTWAKAVGMAMGFSGVVLLVGGGVLDDSGSDREVLGRLACIGGAMCYALNSISIRRLPPVDPIGLTTMLMLSGCLITLPVSLVAEGWPPLPTPPALWALIALGLVSTAAMHLLRVLVIRSAGPTFLTLVNYQLPVWSVVLGALILGEALPPSLLSALALILGGVAISQWAGLRRLMRRVRLQAGEP